MGMLMLELELGCATTVLLLNEKGEALEDGAGDDALE